MTDDEPMETLSQATTRLTRAGYAENYTARDGRLVGGHDGPSHDPANMAIDEVVRFEGESDPGDEAIVYALDAGHGHQGLYVAAYGSAATADDMAVATALLDSTG